jgi:hypothetical protein
VIDSVNRIRDDCLSRLVIGSCGKYEWNALESVSNLIILFIRTCNFGDRKAQITLALQHEHFLLGDIAKQVTLGALIRFVDASNADAETNCSLLLEEIWRLHQVEDVESLPESDEVARFINMYR